MKTVVAPFEKFLQLIKNQNSSGWDNFRFENFWLCGRGDLQVFCGCEYGLGRRGHLIPFHFSCKYETSSLVLGKIVSQMSRLMLKGPWRASAPNYASEERITPIRADKVWRQGYLLLTHDSPPRKFLTISLRSWRVSGLYFIIALS